MTSPLARIRLPRSWLRRPTQPADQPAADGPLSEIASLVPPIPRRPPARWATDEAYVEMARRLLTVMGARVGADNRIAATMARSMGASKHPARTLQELRDECKQVLSALGELRKVQGQLAEQTGEVDGIEPLAVIARKKGG